MSPEPNPFLRRCTELPPIFIIISTPRSMYENSERQLFERVTRTRCVRCQAKIPPGRAGRKCAACRTNISPETFPCR